MIISRTTITDYKNMFEEMVAAYKEDHYVPIGEDGSTVEIDTAYFGYNK